MKIGRMYLAAAGLISSSMLVQSSVLAQEQPAERSQEEATRAFLANKQKSQAEKSRRISDAANLGSLNGIVRALGVKPPKPRFVSDSQTLTALNDALIVDIAQLLAERGFKAGDLRNARAQPELVGAAAANHIRGTASLNDELLLSDTVLVGQVVSTNNSEDLGDGFRSTVSVKVDRVGKGTIKPGQIVKIRRKTGVLGSSGFTDSSEEPFADGTQVALLGSVGLYQSAAPSGRKCADCVLEQVPVFRVEGQSLVPTGGSTMSGTLSALSLK
jgi:hypothetical protein